LYKFLQILREKYIDNLTVEANILSIFGVSCVKCKRKEIIMNQTYNTKNKFLKTIALGSFLFGGFAGTFSQLQAGPLHDSVAADNMTRTYGLLRQGADPNEIDECGCKPLFYADSRAMIDLLCRAGADPNLPDETGDTPLHNVLCVVHPNLDLAKALLQKGARTDIKNQMNQTPVSMEEQIIRYGIVTSWFDSMTVDDEGRKTHTKALLLLLLPPHLWHLIGE
jgi:hypothetical protein